MRDLYFAYGSNLKVERMQARVHSAAVLGSARLPGFRLTCDKRGADGSGKANLRLDATGEVWGAIYVLDPADWGALDACEARYTRFGVRVQAGAELLGVQTYRSNLLTDHPVAFEWYRRLIVEGAREHALPDAYLRSLAEFPARND